MLKNKNILNLTISPRSHAFEASAIDGQFISLLDTNVKIQQNSDFPLIQKKGKHCIESEIKIYELIASNPKSEQKAFLQPILIEKKQFEPTLYFRLMHGGSLKLHQTYLLDQLKNKTKSVESWLIQQLLSLLDTLDHLHTSTFGLEQNKGIIHGDIKPDNILINEFGNWVLADFDCAYQANKPAHRFGSHYYMAPELFANMDFTKMPILNIDKSDIWSLGITLYQLLNVEFPDFSNNSTQKFFKEKMVFKNNHCLIEDNINIFIIKKNWGGNYSKSPIAKKARKSLKLLQENNNQKITLLTYREILNHLSMAMLTPIEERPNAKMLFTLIKGLQKNFPSTNDQEYQQFITDLLNHSPLNRDAGVNTYLKSETEPSNKRIRIFS